MSNQIDVAFVQQYAGNVIHLSQQAPSKFRGAVRIKDVVGKNAFFERIAATTASKRTDRHADTKYTNTLHSRRRVSLEDWEWADLVDKQDEIRLLINPQNEYAINAAKAMNRTIDDLIIAAFNGNAVSVDAVDATSNVALSAGQLIANGGTNLTLAKLRTASRLLNDADVEDEDRFVAISPAGLEKLLSDSQVTSADFAAVKALVNGDINSYMGFQFIKSTRLPKSGNIRSCFAWQRNGLGLAMGKDVDHKIDVLPGKSYSTQIYFCMTLGVTRVEEARVVQIDIDETA